MEDNDELSKLNEAMREMLMEQDPVLSTAHAGNLTELTQIASTLKAEVDRIDAELSSVKKKFELAKADILKTMDLMEIDKVDMSGFLFYRKRKSSVTTPKTIEEKEKLFNFLQEQGIFLEIASVNSMTLNSLYKDLAEKAAENGILDYKIPGVGDPTEYISLEMRKSK